MVDLKLLWNKFKLALLLFGTAFFGGAGGYKLIYPEASWTDCFFMTIITITAVGYKEVLEVSSNPVGAWFTTFLIIIGIGIVLYAVSMVTVFLIEGKLNTLLLINSIKRRVKKLKNHIIICGLGRTSIHVLRDLYKSKEPFVIIDTNEDHIESLRKEFPHCLILIGDATSEEVLMEANINKAKTLVSTLSQDKDNLVLTFTARMLNPTLNIIARAIDVSLREKLIRAGANSVISPNYIGGKTISNQILHPNVHSFIDRLINGDGHTMSIREVSVPAHSNLIGKTLIDSLIYKETDVKIIAYSQDGKEKNFTYNPPTSSKIEEETTIVFIGSETELEAVESIIDARH
jgi:voltage-gated potassium channel